MRYIIDRFEGEYAVIEIEDGSYINIPRAAIPAEAKEGDIIRTEISKEDTSTRKQAIEEKMKKLFVD